MKLIRTTKKYLPVPLTEEEIRLVATGHAVAVVDQIELAEDHKFTAERMKREKDDAAARLRSSATILNNRSEERLVSVVVVVDDDREREITVRLDTMEVVVVIPEVLEAIRRYAAESEPDRVAEEEDASGSLASKIFEFVQMQAGGIPMDEITSRFGESATAVTWVMINVGDLERSTGGFVTAESEALVYDADAMLRIAKDPRRPENDRMGASNPDQHGTLVLIRTPETLKPLVIGEVLKMDEPGISIVALHLEISENGDEQANLVRGVELAVEEGSIDAFSLKWGPDTLRYWPPPNSVNDESLVQIYRAVTSKQPGNKGRTALLKAIEAAKVAP